MDASPLFSAFMGLAGVAVGGITTFASTWLTQAAAAREKRRQMQAGKREKLFNEFVMEASRLYGDALSHEKDDITDLVRLYALIGRMRLICGQPVIDAAERTMTSIIRTYAAPNKSIAELREMAHSGALNPLIDFDIAGRQELARFWDSESLPA